MNPISPPKKSFALSNIGYWLAFLLCIVAVGGTGWWVWRDISGHQEAALARSQAEQARKQRWKFYQDKVTPLLKTSQAQNAEAVERAVKRLEERIDGYRAGIQPFVDDIMGWGTRFKVLWYLPGDKIAGKNEIANLIKEKFDKHLFSETKLRDDLQKVFDTLRDDFQANQNRLLTDARAISESEGAKVKIPDISTFSEEVRSRMLQHTQGNAQDSVSSGLATFITSTAIGMTAEHFLKQLLISAGTSMAVDAAAVGGGTAGGAAGGAELGSFGGPAGTAAGFVVGTLVGLVVDWWMTDDFKTKTNKELNAQLDKLQDTLKNGDKKNPGLLALFDELKSRVSAAQETELHGIFIAP